MVTNVHIFVRFSSSSFSQSIFKMIFFSIYKVERLLGLRRSMFVHWKLCLRRKKWGVDGLLRRWSNDGNLRELGTLGMARIVRMVIQMVIYLDIWIQQRILGCKCLKVDQASCIHGYGDRKLDQDRKGVDVVLHRHIWHSSLNTLHCLGRFRIGIHSQGWKLQLLKIKMKNFTMIFDFFILLVHIGDFLRLQLF